MMSKNILHLSADNAFVDMALYYFEQVAPQKNTVYIYTDKDVCYIQHPALTISTQKAILKIQPKDYRLIIIHQLSEIWYQFILNTPKDIPILWIGWGGDYYDLINVPLLLPKTKSFLPSLSPIEKIKRTVKNIIRPNKWQVISCIDYFAPVLKNEYPLVRANCNNKVFPSFIDFNYGSLEKNFIDQSAIVPIKGENILLGNSATNTNNHIEAIDFIK